MAFVSNGGTTKVVLVPKVAILPLEVVLFSVNNWERATSSGGGGKAQGKNQAAPASLNMTPGWPGETRNYCTDSRNTNKYKVMEGALFFVVWNV